MTSVQKALDPKDTIQHAENSSSKVKIQWGDGHKSVYLAIWLRHSFVLQVYRKAESGSEERFVRTGADETPIAKVEVSQTGELIVHWKSDDEPSRFNPTWLRQRCSSDKQRKERRRAPILWTSAIGDRYPQVDYQSLRGDDAARLEAHRGLIDYGVLVIRGAPDEPEAVEEIAPLFGPIAVTPYGEGGRIFDVRFDPESMVQISANSARLVPLHMDETSRYFTPGISMLHCITSHPEGGESIVTDGFAVCEALKAAEPASYDLLTKLPMYFSRIDNTGQIFHSIGKVICVDFFGNLMGVRFNQGIEPVDAPEDMLKPAYAALAAFAKEWSDPKYQLRLTLRPGEVLVFDNQRLFHGRTGFNPGAGKRHLQYCAVDRDLFHVSFRRLSKKLGHDDWRQLLPAGAIG